MVLVTGEAGVGKTRFVTEALRPLRPSVQVLAGGCVDVAGGTVPFAPMVEALRRLARELPEEELDLLLGPGRADLARLLPQLQRPGARNRRHGSRLRLSSGPPVRGCPWPARSTFRSEPDGAGRRGHPLGGSFDARPARLSRPEPAAGSDPAPGDVPKRRTAPASSAGALPGRAAPQSADHAHRPRPLRSSRSRGPGRGDRGPSTRHGRLSIASTRARKATRSSPRNSLQPVGRLPARSRRRFERSSPLELPPWTSRASSCSGSPLRPGRASGRACWRPSSAWTTRRCSVGCGRRSSTRSCCRRTMPGRANSDSVMPSCARPCTPTCCPPNERGSTRASQRSSKACPRWIATPRSPRRSPTTAMRPTTWDGRLEASVRAGIAAESAWAFAEAQVQFERALELWDQVPDGRTNGFTRSHRPARARRVGCIQGSGAAGRGAHPRGDRARRSRPGCRTCRSSAFRTCRITAGWSATAGARWMPAARPSGSCRPVRHRWRGHGSPPLSARSSWSPGSWRTPCRSARKPSSWPGPSAPEKSRGTRSTRSAPTSATSATSRGGLDRLEQAREIARDVGNVEDVARAYGNIVDLHERRRVVRARPPSSPRMPLTTTSPTAWHGSTARPPCARARSRCIGSVGGTTLMRCWRGSTGTSFPATR